MFIALAAPLPTGASVTYGRGSSVVLKEQLLTKHDQTLNDSKALCQCVIHASHKCVIDISN